MLDIMSQAQNAIEAYNTALKATSSNIANMNVTGYKRVNVTFQSIFEKVLNNGSAASGNQGGSNPEQLGQGMAIGGANLDFSSGEFVSGSSINLAIQGQGLFVVSADGGKSYLYTRAGNFTIDSNGNLLQNNMQIYGLDSAGNIKAISKLPSGTATNYRWQTDGTLEYAADGVNFTTTGYRIALTYFPNPGGLIQSQGTTFAESAASGSAAAFQAPGGAAGSLKTGQLEQSNVFYLTETINALEMQRAMSGNLTMLRMASDIISQFISKLS